MLSRDADACYWIGRYVERAEATARMVDVHYHAALEAPLSSGSGENEGLQPMQWHTLLEISGSIDQYAARYAAESDRDVLQFFVFDRENADSIVSTWTQARENARSIREQLASEMWESVNITYRQLLEWNVERVLASSPHQFFQLVKNGSHLFQGILNRTMLMGEARDWLDVGRFLERAGQTARLLDVKYHDLLPAHAVTAAEIAMGRDDPQPAMADPFGVGGPLDMHGWIAVLKSVSAFEMYRKVHHSGITPARVVAFLLLNTQFPASVRHGIARVEGCLKRISGNLRDEAATEPERLTGRLRADLTYTRAEEIIASGLHEFIEGVQDRCAAIGNAVARTYLSY